MCSSDLRVRCFAADWRGRVFGVDTTPGARRILLLDVATATVSALDADLRTFHEEALVDLHEDAVAATRYVRWREHSGDAAPLRWDECVGYATPLLAGGKDTAANQARTDALTYWTLTGRLIAGLGR